MVEELKKEIKIDLTLKEADYIIVALGTCAKSNKEYSEKLLSLAAKIAKKICQDFNCKNYEDFKKIMKL